MVFHPNPDCPGEGSPPPPPEPECLNLLVDSSRAAGDWWFPQLEGYFPLVEHEGKDLAEYLRDQHFYVPELYGDNLQQDHVPCAGFISPRSCLG